MYPLPCVGSCCWGWSAEATPPVLPRLLPPPHSAGRRFPVMRERILGSHLRMVRIWGRVGRLAGSHDTDRFTSFMKTRGYYRADNKMDAHYCKAKQLSLSWLQAFQHSSGTTDRNYLQDSLTLLGQSSVRTGFTLTGRGLLHQDTGAKAVQCFLNSGSHTELLFLINRHLCSYYYFVLCHLKLCYLQLVV